MEVIKGITEVLGPTIDAVLKPVKDLLDLIGNALGVLFLPILEALYTPIKVVCDLLSTILTPIFLALVPVFKIVGFAIQCLFFPIQLVARLIYRVINGIIDIVNWFLGIINSIIPGTANDIRLLEHVIVNDLILPVVPTFHTGGTATSDMLAVLRKDEEVLSPAASKRYRDGEGNIYVTINAPNVIDPQRAAELVAVGMSYARR